MKDWQQLTSGIEPLDREAMRRAEERLDRLTKPPGSLGRLEELAVKLAGITGEPYPHFAKKTVIVMAADHGVCAEGISAFPAEVTGQMVLNFLNGGAAVNVLARHAGAEVLCVDIGVNGELDAPGLISRKIRPGTANMAEGPAMSRAEALAAVQTGLDVVKDAYAAGSRLFVTGEMGIGNTTASSAVTSALTGVDPHESVGRGTGIDDERLRHKSAVVRKALEATKPQADDPLDVLAKVGGLEIGGLVGVILGAAKLRCPVVIDGFISSAAALLAQRMAPHAAGYMIASHLSAEKGHALLLRELKLKAMLDMDMRLGEGSGGVLALHLIDAAHQIMTEMATFDSAGISGKEES